MKKNKNILKDKRKSFGKVMKEELQKRSKEVMLDFKIFENYEEMSIGAADEITENLRKNPRQLFCIAAGYTSTGVLRELARRYEEGVIDFSQASFVAMDEWTNMDAYTEGSCGWFLQENFLSKVNYKKENVFLWNGKSENYYLECERAKKFIQEHSQNEVIDNLILGLGMNGHLALNEPGTFLEESAHVVQLDAVTAKVGQKYFKENTSLTGGLTLGLAEFREAKRSILLVSGERKRDILGKLREKGEFQPALPATAIYAFEDVSVYCDKASWGE